MYGFPTILHPNHDEAPQRMFFDDSSMFGFAAGTAIFYSKKDGQWGDPATWEVLGNSGRFGLPTANDIIFIRHNVTVGILTATCYHLFVSGALSWPGTLTVTGNVQSVGVVDMTSGGTLNLLGTDNAISNLIGGLGIINYAALVNQTILNLPYYSLTVSGKGDKNLIADLLLQGDFLGSTSLVRFQTASYNVTVGGTTTTASTFWFNNGYANYLFIGKITPYLIYFYGNPDVECRGGFEATGGVGTVGTGIWNFTTNNQTFKGDVLGGVTTFNSIIITGAITVTTIGGRIKTNLLNGTVAGSTLLNSNTLYLNSATDAMSTGVLDISTTGTNILGYSVNGNYTLPFTAYKNLGIGGTGTKTLSGNTIVESLTNITSVAAGNLELSSYNFTVNGTSVFCTIYKSSATGTTLFIGLVSCNLNFSGSDVEFRGGLSSFLNFNAGGRFIFSTNNQTIAGATGGVGGSVQPNILISGAINITLTNRVRLTNIDGDNASSTLYINGEVHYTDSIAPMITGIMNCSSSLGTFLYDASGNQDVKGGTYYNLTLSGSGVKKLQGNVVVTGTYTLSGTATLDLNGYTLT